VFRLHFDYGYSARKIADMLKVGDEVSDPTIQPPPMSEDKMKRFASIVSNYGVEIKR